MPFWTFTLPRMGAGGAGLIEIANTQSVGTAQLTANSWLVIPEDVEDGYLLIHSDRRQDSTQNNTPTGFTTLANTETTTGGKVPINARQIVSYRIVSGDTPGANIVGMGGTAASHKTLISFRKPGGFSSVTPKGIKTQASQANLVANTIDSGNISNSVITWAVYGLGIGFGSTTTNTDGAVYSPQEDQSVKAAINTTHQGLETKCTVYRKGQAEDITVDLDVVTPADAENRIMQTGYLDLGT